MKRIYAQLSRLNSVIYAISNKDSGRGWEAEEHPQYFFINDQLPAAIFDPPVASNTLTFPLSATLKQFYFAVWVILY